MSRPEFLQKYRAELLAERQSKIEAINVEYQGQIDALDVLLSRQILPPLPNTTNGTIDNVARIIRYRRSEQTVLECVRQAIAQITAGEARTTFTSPDLLTHLRQCHPTLNVRQADLANRLWHLKRVGEI